ncbi:MAG: potassium transporter TrkG [Pseudomonadota bacterium]
MAGVLRIVAFSLILLSVIIGVAAFSSRSTDTPTGLDFRSLVLAGLLFYISLCVVFVFRKTARQINRVEGCFLAVLLWVVLPVPAALALLSFTDMDPVDALFEAVSGLTTTGMTVFDTLEGVPTPVIVLRGTLQWLGGLMTLVIVVAILAPLGIAGLPDDQATVVNREATVFRGGVGQTVLSVAGAYAIITVGCFVLLAVTEVPIFEAYYLTLSTVSSGGFVPSDTPISELGNPFAPFVLIVFMVIAGTNIIWQRLLVGRRLQLLRSHKETYFYLAAIVVFGFVYAAVFFNRAGSVDVLTPFDAITEGLFTAASLISTTGFEIRNSSFSVLPVALVAILVLIGGCSFSTAGGISFYRVGGMMNRAFTDLSQLVYPSSIYSARFGSQRYMMSLMKAIWTYFFAVIFVVMIGTVLLSLNLDSFEAALIASIAAFANIGAFYSTGWSETGQWVRFADMDSSSKLVLCVLMILGRLHILTLLTAFNLTYWNRAR